MGLERANSIAEELERTAPMRRAVGLATPVFAAFLDLVSFGAAGEIVNGIAGALADPKVEEKLASLARLVAQQEPRLEQLDRLAALPLIQKLLTEQEEVLAARLDLQEALPPNIRDALRIETRGGDFEAREIDIEAMDLHAASHDGGHNELQDVNLKDGSATFITGEGSSQSLSRSSFKGRTPGMTSEVHIADAALGPGDVRTNTVARRFDGRVVNAALHIIKRT